MGSLPCGKCNIAGWLVGEQPIKTSAFNCVCSCLFSCRREKETTVWAEKETTFWALKCTFHPGKPTPDCLFFPVPYIRRQAQIHSRNGVGCGCVQHQIYWATQKWICYIPFLMPSRWCSLLREISAKQGVIMSNTEYRKG